MIGEGGSAYVHKLLDLTLLKTGFQLSLFGCVEARRKTVSFTD
jgi:hypothetical protein